MVRADMVRIAFEYRLEDRNDFESILTGLAVFRPKLPRCQVHLAICVQRRRIEIVRILFVDCGHRVFIFD